jgi:hypothetical protein
MIHGRVSSRPGLCRGPHPLLLAPLLHTPARGSQGCGLIQALLVSLALVHLLRHTMLPQALLLPRHSHTVLR